MPSVFDGEIQEILFNSGKYADLVSPLDPGIHQQDPAVSVIIN